jgi:hypothetical protein
MCIYVGVLLLPVGQDSRQEEPVEVYVVEEGEIGAGPFQDHGQEDVDGQHLDYCAVDGCD